MPVRRESCFTRAVRKGGRVFLFQGGCITPCGYVKLTGMDFPWIELLNASASIATAAGVFVAVWQIRADLRMQTTEFEDQLDRESREIALALPLEALFGEQLTPELAARSLEHFHRYFDLANQLIFLRETGRVTDSRWEGWCDEIKLNLSKPAFALAWEEVKRRAPGEFILLRRLESVGYDTDPRDW